MSLSMINRFSFIISFCFLFVLLSAFNGFSTPADSIRVKWVDGKKFVLHKVDPKETWIQLSKRYNASIQELKDANKGVEDLKIGQIINVPVSPVLSPAAAATSAEAKSKDALPAATPQGTITTTTAKTPVVYTVKQGETLFSISKKFEQTVDKLKSYNNLTTDVLSEGQKLIVRYSGINATPSASSIHVVETGKQNENTTAEASKPVPSLAEFEKPTKTVFPVKKNTGGKTLMQVNETGVAAWIQDGQLNQNKYYGLHRSAPIGTIIKVTNRMNNQFVYVKIVGLLPDTGDNDNLIIKVSQAVSNKLNALDAHFRVELSYGLMQ